jgi:hypothetical protein
MGREVVGGDDVACPTCSHTFTPMGCCTVTGRPFHWCPRCGSVRDCDGNVTAPALVDFSRGFARRMLEDPICGSMTSTCRAEFLRRWDGSGVRDSINVPADRP